MQLEAPTEATSDAATTARAPKEATPNATSTATAPIPWDLSKLITPTSAFRRPLPNCHWCPQEQWLVLVIARVGFLWAVGAYTTSSTALKNQDMEALAAALELYSDYDKRKCDHGHKTLPYKASRTEC